MSIKSIELIIIKHKVNKINKKVINYTFYSVYLVVYILMERRQNFLLFYFNCLPVVYIKEVKTKLNLTDA